MPLTPLNHFVATLRQAFPEAMVTEHFSYSMRVCCRTPENFLRRMAERKLRVDIFWVYENATPGWFDVYYEARPASDNNDAPEASKEDPLSAEELRRIANQARERKTDEMSEVLKPLLEAEFVKTAEEGEFDCRMSFKSVTVLTSDTVIFRRALEKTLDTHFPGVCSTDGISITTEPNGKKGFHCSFSWREKP